MTDAQVNFCISQLNRHYRTDNKHFSGPFKSNLKFFAHLLKWGVSYQPLTNDLSHFESPACFQPMIQRAKQQFVLTI